MNYTEELNTEIAQAIYELIKQYGHRCDAFKFKGHSYWGFELFRQIDSEIKYLNRQLPQAVIQSESKEELVNTLSSEWIDISTFVNDKMNSLSWEDYKATFMELGE